MQFALLGRIDLGREERPRHHRITGVVAGAVKPVAIRGGDTKYVKAGT